jgi:hypothetical protein
MMLDQRIPFATCAGSIAPSSGHAITHETYLDYNTAIRARCLQSNTPTQLPCSRTHIPSDLHIVKARSLEYWLDALKALFDRAIGIAFGK